MFSEIKSVHFVGIRHGHGLGSSRVEGKGYEVTGSDQNVYPPMSTFLAEHKIAVMNGYAERNLAHQTDLVVIGNAISRAAIPGGIRAGSQAAILFRRSLLREFSSG